LFSLYYKGMSRSIGRKKIENITDTMADTVVTSCPGYIMQLESLKREANVKVHVRHIVEVIAEAME